MLKLTKTVLRIQYWRSLKKLLTGQNRFEGASILARTFLQCSPLYYITLHYIFFKGGLRGKFFEMWKYLKRILRALTMVLL